MVPNRPFEDCLVDYDIVAKEVVTGLGKGMKAVMICSTKMDRRIDQVAT